MYRDRHFHSEVLGPRPRMVQNDSGGASFASGFIGLVLDRPCSRRDHRPAAIVFEPASQTRFHFSFRQMSSFKSRARLIALNTNVEISIAFSDELM